LVLQYSHDEPGVKHLKPQLAHYGAQSRSELSNSSITTTRPVCRNFLFFWYSYKTVRMSPLESSTLLWNTCKGTSMSPEENSPCSATWYQCHMQIFPHYSCITVGKSVNMSYEGRSPCSGTYAKMSLSHGRNVCPLTLS